MDGRKKQRQKEREERWKDDTINTHREHMTLRPRMMHY
jgi:hypothetical protein